MKTEYFPTKIIADLPLRVKQADTWWEVKMREGEREDKLPSRHEGIRREGVYLSHRALRYLVEAVRIGVRCFLLVEP